MSFSETISGKGQLLPQEEMLELKQMNRKLSIGVPKETSFEENRVALVPNSVRVLVQNGHRVIVEREAGKSAYFFDHEYAEAGAELCETVEEVFQSDVIVKIAPPTLKELEIAKPRVCIISALHLTAQSESYFRKLIEKRILAISFEHLRDKTNSFPLMRSLSEIVGNTAILIAAEYLSSTRYGRGKILGGFSGINPSEVVIIGAGNVGEFASRTAIGMGALVKVFDNNIYKLRTLQNHLGHRVFTCILEPEVLTNSLRTADVAVGAMHAINGNSPLVVHEPLIKQMKTGSVIVDVSIDQGGCFETSRPTTHSNPVFIKHNVTHYCVPNICSRVPHTASYALSNHFGPMLLRAGDAGGIEGLIKAEPGFRKGVYMYSGSTTNLYISNLFKVPYQDIDLLMATYRP